MAAAGRRQAIPVAVTPTTANTASSGWNPGQPRLGGLEADRPRLLRLAGYVLSQTEKVPMLGWASSEQDRALAPASLHALPGPLPAARIASTATRSADCSSGGLSSLSELGPSRLGRTGAPLSGERVSGGNPVPQFVVQFGGRGNANAVGEQRVEISSQL